MPIHFHFCTALPDGHDFYDRADDEYSTHWAGFTEFSFREWLAGWEWQRGGVQPQEVENYWDWSQHGIPSDLWVWPNSFWTRCGLVPMLLSVKNY